MESKQIEKITSQVEKRFPEAAGVRPSIRRQELPSSDQKGSKESEPNYTLTYKFSAEGPGGQRIPRWIRVVATPNGKILKITTSK
jgi:hypothetical protein